MPPICYPKADFPERELYEDAIKRHVCSHCIDFGTEGKCHAVDPQGCAVYRFLPELVAIAESLPGELKIEPYIQAVRESICMRCRNQFPAGKCELRDTVDCGLDRYLPLVLEAIEEVNRQLGSY